MKKITPRLVTLLLSGLLMGLAPATWAQEARLAFVNTQRVMDKAPQAKAARELLKNEFAPRDQKIVAMQKELKKLEEDLARNAQILSDSVRIARERKITSLKRDIKRARDEFLEDLNLRRNEELGKLQKLISDAIVNVARESGYDIVLGDTVLYASERVDITDKVLERLRKQGGATPAAGKDPGLNAR